MVPIELIGMVADLKISKNAALLYVVLLSYVNHKRGDFVVWPSRETLAFQLGVKKAESIDAYMAELKAAGLVTSTERRNGKERLPNLYTLHLTSSVGGTKNGATPPPAKTGKDAGHGVAQENGPGSPESGARVAPKKGEELDLEELDQENKKKSSSRSREHAYLVDDRGLDDDDALWLIQQIENKYQPGNMRGYLGTLDDEDLGWWLDKRNDPLSDLFAAESSETGRANFARALHEMEACEHGTRGGHEVYEPTGWVACAFERRRREFLSGDL